MALQEKERKENSLQRQSLNYWEWEKRRKMLKVKEKRNYSFFSVSDG